MSHITRGKLIASHISVRLEGVCDQPVLRCLAIAAAAGLLVLLAARGETAIVEAERSGNEALSVDAADRVARLMGESEVGVPADSKSRGWLLVATIVETGSDLSG